MRLSPRVRVVLGLVVLAVLAAACAGQAPVAEPTPSPTPTPTPSPTQTPTPTPSPTEEDPGPLAPLTGLPVEEAVLERPVAAVKVDNAPGARPQLGLDQADLVFEELVEGGTTRFVALYHSADPGDVGPVRSGRDVDADLLPPFSPVLGISGAAEPTYAVLRGAGLLVFEEGQADGAFYRERSRRAPHNLFATPAKLWAAGADLPPPEAPWPIEQDEVDGGGPAAAALLTFSPRASSSWTWQPRADDGTGGFWLREQDGGPHLTAPREEGGPEGQVTAANVLIVRVPVTGGGGVDVRGNPTAHIEVVGDGEAVVLRDGRQYVGTWRKADRDAHFEWLTPNGTPLPLAPGPTWVELLPTSGGFTVVDAPHEPEGEPERDPDADDDAPPAR